MKVSKIEAARRQICEAIKLFMNGGDAIAVDTLAAAAFRITRDMCDAEKLEHSATKLINNCTRPEYHKTVWKKIQESANFFKHADSDPDEIHDFHPEQTQFFIFLTVMQYEGLTREKIAPMVAYTLWFMLEFPHCFTLPPGFLSELARGWDHSDKARFYRECLIAVHMAGL